jgi:hypothetical protein
MQIIRIAGATRTIGKSQGYLGLPLRDIVLEDAVNGPNTPAMETAWEPTPDELAALNAGAPVILCVLGSGHPPVMLRTGDLPEDAPARPSTADIEQEARFLLDRLADLENGWDDQEAYREFAGHVSPSIARLRRLLDPK